jgi:hypothetical protein
MISDAFHFHLVHFNHPSQVCDRLRMLSEQDFRGEETQGFQSNLGTDHGSR